MASKASGIWRIELCQPSKPTWMPDSSSQGAIATSPLMMKKNKDHANWLIFIVIEPSWRPVCHNLLTSALWLGRIQSSWSNALKIQSILYSSNTFFITSGLQQKENSSLATQQGSPKMWYSLLKKVFLFVLSPIRQLKSSLKRKLFLVIVQSP